MQQKTSSEENSVDCPLCGSHQQSVLLQGPDLRKYLNCLVCDVAWVESIQHLSQSEEARRYRLHNNEESDPRYVQYLEKKLNTAFDYIKAESRVVDYGCGATSLIARLSAARGIQLKEVCRYDPLFFPEEPVEKQFDVVVCNEVVEHFKNPKQDWLQMAHWLRPAGILAVGTLPRPPNEDDFNEWWYAKDPTHIVFYRLKTFEKINSWNHCLLFLEEKGGLFFFKKTGAIE